MVAAQRWQGIVKMSSASTLPCPCPCPACVPCPHLPPAVMLRSDGKDIVKKSSSRRGRYLLVFNFQLAPAAAGKLVSACLPACL